MKNQNPTGLLFSIRNLGQIAGIPKYGPIASGIEKVVPRVKTETGVAPPSGTDYFQETSQIGKPSPPPASASTNPAAPTNAPPSYEIPANPPPAVSEFESKTPPLPAPVQPSNKVESKTEVPPNEVSSSTSTLDGGQKIESVKVKSDEKQPSAPIFKIEVPAKPDNSNLAAQGIASSSQASNYESQSESKAEVSLESMAQTKAPDSFGQTETTSQARLVPTEAQIFQPYESLTKSEEKKPDSPGSPPPPPKAEVKPDYSSEINAADKKPGQQQSSSPTPNNSEAKPSEPSSSQSGLPPAISHISSTGTLEYSSENGPKTPAENSSPGPAFSIQIPSPSTADKSKGQKPEAANPYVDYPNESEDHGQSTHVPSLSSSLAPSPSIPEAPIGPSIEKIASQETDKGYAAQNGSENSSVTRSPISSSSPSYSASKIEESSSSVKLAGGENEEAGMQTKSPIKPANQISVQPAMVEHEDYPDETEVPQTTIQQPTPKRVFEATTQFAPVIQTKEKPPPFTRVLKIQPIIPIAPKVGILLDYYLTDELWLF